MIGVDQGFLLYSSLLTSCRRDAEAERHRPWFEPLSVGPRPTPLSFQGFKLGSCLLTITKGVVSAEWDLFTAGKEKFFAALHQVLLIECPWIHEVLEHDHEHVLGQISDG